MPSQEEIDRDRYRYLQLKQKMSSAKTKSEDQPSKSFGSKAMDYAKSGSYLPAMGSAVGGTLGAGAGTVFGMGVGAVPGALGGAALGGAGGEAARQILQRLQGKQAPQTSLEAAKGINEQAAYGVGGEALGMGAGRALKPLAKPLESGLGKLGGVASKGVEAITGLKPEDVMQTSRQGLKTYFAPSMEKAQQIFGSALEKEGIASRQPLKQLIDPQLSTARKVALDIAGKLEKGGDLTAEEALRGRQAIDRIIAGTSMKDRATRGGLMEVRSALDDALSNKSGSLAEASRIYRKAIVKSNILNPMKITKQGQFSAVAPLLATGIGGLAGTEHGKGAGIGSAAAVMAASSPLLYGLATASGADLARGVQAIATNPTVQRAFMQELVRMRKSKQNPNPDLSNMDKAVQQGNP